MDELPWEIITNILSRLQLKSIFQFNNVSKYFHSIISDYILPTIELTHQLPPGLLLRFKSNTTNSSRIYYLQDDESLKKPLRPWKLLDESFLSQAFHYRNFYIVGSCNGFICLFHPMRAFYGEEAPVCVFNPITEHHFELPCTRFPRVRVSRGDRWLTGFGFEECEREYKFVFIIFVENGNVFDSEVRVNTLGSNTWRRQSNAVPEALRLCEEIVSPAFLNGCFHWITVDLSSFGPLIVSFNLGVEEFGFISTPRQDQYTYRRYGLGLIEDCLCVLETNLWESCVNVWVMKEYNVRESWVKQFRINQRVLGCDTAPKLIKLRENGEFLFLCGDQYLIGYNTVTRKVRRLSLGWDGKKHGYQLEVLPLVASIHSVKTIFGVEHTRTTMTSIKRKRLQ